MSVMVALSDASTITISVIGFFALLVIIALARAVMRRDQTPYRRYRLGIFVERDDGVDTPPDVRDDRPAPPA